VGLENGLQRFTDRLMPVFVARLAAAFA
jgi:hypothetical protein